MLFNGQPTRAEASPVILRLVIKKMAIRVNIMVTAADSSSLSPWRASIEAAMMAGGMIDSIRTAKKTDLLVSLRLNRIKHRGRIILNRPVSRIFLTGIFLS